MLTKKSAVTGLFRALWYKKRRVLSVLKILERDQKIRIFGDFCKKCQKSDFPRKRSQNLKKSFQFVTIKKNFFFGNFFADLIFGHTFLCPFFTFAKTFPKKWIFGFFVFFV
jgi:hypothetical protein